jgi:hypothetical protein
MIWLSVNFDVFILNLLRLCYEKILLLTSVNLRGDYLTNTNPKLTGAFLEVSREFEQLGFNTIPHHDTKAISSFAKQALVAEGFALQH